MHRIMTKKVTLRKKSTQTSKRMTQLKVVEEEEVHVRSKSRKDFVTLRNLNG